MAQLYDTYMSSSEADSSATLPHTQFPGVGTEHVIRRQSPPPLEMDSGASGASSSTSSSDSESEAGLRRRPLARGMASRSEELQGTGVRLRGTSKRAFVGSRKKKKKGKARQGHGQLGPARATPDYDKGWQDVWAEEEEDTSARSDTGSRSDGSDTGSEDGRLTATDRCCDRLIMVLFIAPMVVTVVMFVALNWPFMSFSGPPPLSMHKYLDSVMARYPVPQHRWYKTREDKLLCYHDFPSEFYRPDEVSSAPTVILYHSLSFNSSYLTALAHKLSGRAQNVIVPDIRSHGHSLFHRRGHVNYRGELVDDLYDLVLYLKRGRKNRPRQGPDAKKDYAPRIILVGHGAAGSFVLHLLAEHPTLASLFQGVVLISPFLNLEVGIDVRPTIHSLLQFNHPRWQGLRLLNWLGIERFNYKDVAAVQHDAAHGDILPHPFYCSMEAIREFIPLAVQHLDYTSMLQHVPTTCKILVLEASHDEVLLPRKPLMQRFLPRTTQFVTIPNSKHYNMLDHSLTSRSIARFAVGTRV